MFPTLMLRDRLNGIRIANIFIRLIKMFSVLRQVFSLRVASQDAFVKCRV